MSASVACTLLTSDRVGWLAPPWLRAAAALLMIGLFAIALLLPLGLLLPGLNAFPYPNPESAYSDLVLAHYPYTAYLRAALLEGGRLPFWSPIILSGQHWSGCWPFSVSGA